jgi:hypothetical protein
MPLAVSFNRKSANWRLYNCTCFRALAVFFTPISCVSVDIKMADVKKQRICIQFCLKLNKTDETIDDFRQLYKEHIIAFLKYYLWFSEIDVLG